MARGVLLLFGLLIIGMAAAFLLTGDRVWLVRAKRTLIVGLVLALIFFVGMFVQELFWPRLSFEPLKGAS
ncbi:MAG: hypothetical protein AB7P21_15740 [Lautropia sp.]